MGSAFHGAIDAHVAIPAPHCGPGGTMNFNIGGTSMTDGPKRNREPFSTVPFARDPDFVDRPDILAWIRESCSAPGSRAALVGLGGVGKSQLAIQYCHDVRAASPPTWVFWVHASTRARFEEAYRDIADRLELPGRHDPNIDTLKLVRNWLCDGTNGRWTMVLDNADDVEVFYPKRKRAHDSEDTATPCAVFLPQSRNGSILVTSRSKDAAVRLVGSSKNTKEVRTMDESQALQLLRNKLENVADEGSMADLIYALDRIPLAISQAAAYINRGAPRMTVPRYIADFRKNEMKKTSLLNRDNGDLRRDERASNAVITTWQISFEQIRKERPSAADLLSLMSFFNPQAIPESVLRSHTSSLRAQAQDSTYINGSEGDDDDSDFREDVDTLRVYSLVTAIAECDAYEMHHLVQFCTRVWLSSFNEVERWRRKFFVLMAREFPNGGYENWTKCQTLLPHVEPIFGSEPGDIESTENRAQVLSNAAWYMWKKGLYTKAESLAVSAVEIRERVVGHNDPGTLLSVSILAVVLQDQGKYEAAEEMNRRALEGKEKVLGKDHPDTLVSVNNLASVLQYQGKYEAAEEMNRRALEGKEKALGRDHPSTLTSVNNLARVLQHQGKYEAAEEMNRRALEGYEKALGKDHPNTLASVHDLAGVLQDQGKYEAAQEMNRRALEGYEKALGKDHPNTLASVHNLADVLRNQGKYEAAEEMNRRALEGREKALGKDHPNTLASVNNLAHILKYQGKYEAAEEMNRRALEGYEKVLGKDHPETLKTAGNLSMLLRIVGRYKEAEITTLRVLHGHEKALGEDHPDTLTSVHNLAGVLQDQGKYEAAQEMNRRALEGKEKALGKDHPETLVSVYCLAFLFHQQRRYADASTLYERASSGYLRVLGPEHPTTIACSQHYASLIQQMRQI